MTKKRMARFSIFIGTWNTTGRVLETDAAPATTLMATDTYHWLAGEQFIVHDVDARFGDQPTRSMEVIGFDAKRKKHFATSYDDQGKSETFDVVLKRKLWTITGKTARFSGKFNRAGDILAGLWELKGKKGWQPWIELTLERA